LIKSRTLRRRDEGRTWNAAVGDDQKLGVATGVREARLADVDGTATSPGALPVQQELYVDIAVPRERHVAASGHTRVVAAVACAVERQQSPAAGAVSCRCRLSRPLARDLQHAVETRVRRPHHRRVVICSRIQRYARRWLQLRSDGRSTSYQG